MNYEVKSIDYQDCKEWFLKKHYARRMPPPIKYCFGLYEGLLLKGVCAYSSSMAINLQKNINYDLIELSRLIIDQTCQKNSLSWFLGKTIKLLPSPLIIISFADVSQNHHGYIYQATNWIYTGLSEPHNDYCIKGLEHLHSKSIMEKSKGQENRVEWLKKTYGDRFYIEARPRKHRYFYFVGDKRDKKKMMKELPYEIQPYPKGENKRYDASYQPTTQIKLL
jgi:hypothetical protein